MIREKKLIESFDKSKLSCSIAENGSPIWVIITHGLAEYAQRHEFFYKLFAQYFNILSYDLRGHGHSDGKRAYVSSFDHYYKDLQSVIDFLVREYRMERFILFGHSMGALITSGYLQSLEKKSIYPEKVFLSSPLVAAAGGLGGIFHHGPESLSATLCGIKASVALPGMINNRALSHDERIFETVMKDELMLKKIHSRLLFEMIHAARKVFSRPLRINCPMGVGIGTKDKLVSFKAAQKYFTQVEKATSFMAIEGGYHELHNDVEKYRAPYFEFLKKFFLEEKASS